MTDDGERGGGEQDWLDPEAIGQTSSPQPSEETCEPLGHGGDPCQERWVSQNRLEVEGEDEDFAAIPRTEERGHGIRRGHGAQSKDAEAHERNGLVQLPNDESSEQDDGDQNDRE